MEASRPTKVQYIVIEVHSVHAEPVPHCPQVVCQADNENAQNVSHHEQLGLVLEYLAPTEIGNAVGTDLSTDIDVQVDSDLEAEPVPQTCGSCNTNRFFIGDGEGEDMGDTLDTDLQLHGNGSGQSITLWQTIAFVMQSSSHITTQWFRFYLSLFIDIAFVLAGTCADVAGCTCSPGGVIVSSCIVAAKELRVTLRKPHRHVFDATMALLAKKRPRLSRAGPQC